MSDIKKFTIDEKLFSKGEDFAKEARKIVDDLLHNNKFKHKKIRGPYHVYFTTMGNGVAFKTRTEENNEPTGKEQHDVQQDLTLAYSLLRTLMRDYNIICDNYQKAVDGAEPRKVEAIDMGRRSLHNEGAEILIKQFEKKVEIDIETARKFFTLIHLIQKRF